MVAKTIRKQDTKKVSEKGPFEYRTVQYWVVHCTVGIQVPDNFISGIEMVWFSDVCSVWSNQSNTQYVFKWLRHIETKW
jgi:hypothetical protein